MAQREKIAALIKSAFVPGFALIALLAIAGYAVLGPTGVLAWSDYKTALTGHSKDLENLEIRRDALKNRIALLDSNGADPDLIGELVRSRLNVVHPDEVIVPLK